MEDQIGLLGLETGGDAGGVPNVHHGRLARQARAGFAEFTIDFEERGLRKIQQGEVSGLEGGHLTAELGADGAASAGNQDAASLDQGAHCSPIEIDGLPGQKLFHADFAHGQKGHAVMLGELDDGRQAQKPDAVILQLAQLVRSQALQATGLVQEENGAGIAVPAAQVRQGSVQLFNALDDADAADLLAHIAGVGPDNADRGPVMVVTTGDIPKIGVSQSRWADEEQRRGLRGPVLNGFQGGEAVEGVLMQGAAKGARAHAAGQLEDRRQGQDRSGDAHGAVNYENSDQKDAYGHDRRTGQHKGVGNGDVTPGRKFTPEYRREDPGQNGVDGDELGKVQGRMTA